MQAGSAALPALAKATCNGAGAADELHATGNARSADSTADYGILPAAPGMLDENGAPMLQQHKV